MSKMKKSIIASIVIVGVTLVVLWVVSYFFDARPGFCCGAPSMDASPHLDLYRLLIMGAGVLALIISNLIIYLKKTKYS